MTQNLAYIVAAGIFKDNGATIQDLVLPVLGVVFTIIVGWRLLQYLASESYGKMIGVFAAALPVALFLYFPSTGVDVIKAAVQTLVG